MRNALLRAARVEALAALDAELRLQGAGRVVDARVDHLAVARRDLARERLAPLAQQHRGAASRERGRRGEADHAAADHDDAGVVAQKACPNARA